MTATTSPVRTRPLPARPDRRVARRTADRREAAELMAEVKALIEAGIVHVSIDDGGALRYRLAHEE